MLLTDLEAVLRSLKSELGLRPIYHSKPQRSEAGVATRRWTGRGAVGAVAPEKAAP